MANSDKDILITTNTGKADKPSIKFNSTNNTPLNLYVQDSGALTIEGTAGQLFSVADGLSGTIFSVNDIAGIPSIDVQDNGNVRIAPFSGKVAIGKSSAAYNLDIGGTVNANVYYQNGLPVGGMTLITSGTLPTTTTSLVINAIPTNFRNLRLVVRNMYSTGNGAQFYIRFNNNASASLHYNCPFSNGNNGNLSWNDTVMYISGSTWSSANYGYTTVDFDDYANTTTYKKAVVTSNHTSSSGEAYVQNWNSIGWFRSTGAVTSIGIYSNSGNWSGGTYQLYGVR